MIYAHNMHGNQTWRKVLRTVLEVFNGLRNTPCYDKAHPLVESRNFMNCTSLLLKAPLVRTREPFQQLVESVIQEDSSSSRFTYYPSQK